MKEGSGMLVLSGSNSYTGGTMVEAGTLVVTVADALPAGTSLIVGGGTSIFAPAASGLSLAGSPAIAESASPRAPVEPVPEPETWVLFIATICGAGAYRFATVASRRVARSLSRAGGRTTTC